MRSFGIYVSGLKRSMVIKHKFNTWLKEKKCKPFRGAYNQSSQPHHLTLNFPPLKPSILNASLIKPRVIIYKF